jgi:hypothetical protein
MTHSLDLKIFAYRTSRNIEMASYWNGIVRLVSGKQGNSLRMERASKNRK